MSPVSPVFHTEAIVNNVVKKSVNDSGPTVGSRQLCLIAKESKQGVTILSYKTVASLWHPGLPGSLMLNVPLFYKPSSLHHLRHFIPSPKFAPSQKIFFQRPTFCVAHLAKAPITRFTPSLGVMFPFFPLVNYSTIRLQIRLIMHFYIWRTFIFERFWRFWRNLSPSKTRLKTLFMNNKMIAYLGIIDAIVP